MTDIDQKLLRLFTMLACISALGMAAYFTFRNKVEYQTIERTK